MKKVLLLTVTLTSLTNQTRASFFDSLFQNPNIKSLVQFGRDQFGNVIQQQLTNAQKYAQNQNINPQALQSGIQNAYNNGGVQGAFNQVTQDFKQFTPGLIDSARSLAQQQQSQVQTAYQKNQIDQIVRSMTTMDQQYGAQVQKINPSWRQSYAQTQINLYNEQMGTPNQKTLADLAQRQIQAVPVLVKNNGNLMPADSTWQQLTDQNGSTYDLNGNLLQQQQAPISFINVGSSSSNSSNGLIGDGSLIKQQITSSITPATPGMTPATPGMTPTVPSITPSTPGMTPTVPSMNSTTPSISPAAAGTGTNSTQIQQSIANAVSQLKNLDMQYGQQLATFSANFASSPFASVPTLNASFFTSYQTTLTQLQSPTAATDPNIYNTLALANRQIQGIPTLISGKGGLCPTDITWQNLTDGTFNINGNLELYDLSGNTLS